MANQPDTKGQAMTTVTNIIPTVGMSISYGIGSDCYHEIIIDVTRNGKSFRSVPATLVYNNIPPTDKDWFTRTADDKAFMANYAYNHAYINWINHMRSEFDMSMTDAIKYVEARIGTNFTIREDGSYRPKGYNSGCASLDTSYEYRDPSF